MPIKTLPYDTAEQFIEALSPTGAVLGAAPLGRVIFRGQADASWSLVPKVLRSDVAATNAAQVRAEAADLRDFLEFADRQGLAIPDDSEVLRHEVGIAADDDGFLDRVQRVRGGLVERSAWPENAMRGLMALAQHHGLRTRMLDWTRSSLIAAYFAAADLMYTNSELLAVWAYDLTKAGAVTRVHHLGSLGVVTVPYAGNRNALVQQGLFTVEQRMMLVAEGPVDITPVEEWLAEVAEEENPLFKMVLHAGQGPRLLRLLARHGIFAATMFPGYDGAARAVREKKLWK